MKITIDIPDSQVDFVLDGFCAATGRPAKSEIKREDWAQGKVQQFILQNAKNGQGRIAQSDINTKVDTAGVVVTAEKIASEVAAMEAAPGKV